MTLKKKKKNSIKDKMDKKKSLLIHWIVIYLVDSAIHLLNNWGPQRGKIMLLCLLNKVDVLTHTKCRPIADNIFQHLTLIFNNF